MIACRYYFCQFATDPPNRNMFQECFAKLIYFISESSLNVQTVHFKSYKN